MAASEGPPVMTPQPYPLWCATADTAARCVSVGRIVGRVAPTPVPETRTAVPCYWVPVVVDTDTGGAVTGIMDVPVDELDQLWVGDDPVALRRAAEEWLAATDN